MKGRSNDEVYKNMIKSLTSREKIIVVLSKLSKSSDEVIKYFEKIYDMSFDRIDLYFLIRTTLIPLWLKISDDPLSVVKCIFDFCITETTFGRPRLRYIFDMIIVKISIIEILTDNGKLLLDLKLDVNNMEELDIIVKYMNDPVHKQHFEKYFLRSKD